PPVKLLPPSNIAGSLNIVAFTDGRPLRVSCSGSAAIGLILMARAITGLVDVVGAGTELAGELKLIAKMIGGVAVELQPVEKAEPEAAPPEAPVERSYAGPRETINYGPDVGKNKPDEK